jgi:hypothetical protein
MVRRKRLSYKSPERGSALLYGIIGLLITLFVYQQGEQLLGPHSHPVIYYALLSILSLITIFSVGCAIHTRILGGGSYYPRHISKEAKTQLQAYKRLIRDSSAKIDELTPLMAHHNGIIDRRGVDCLSVAKKIVNSLEKRLNAVESLIARNNKQDLLEAYELMDHPLLLTGNCYNTLIDSDPIPPIDPEDIAPTLGRLFQTIHAELRRAA